MSIHTFKVWLITHSYFQCFKQKLISTSTQLYGGCSRNIKRQMSQTPGQVRLGLFACPVQPPVVTEKVLLGGALCTSLHFFFFLNSVIVGLVVIVILCFAQLYLNWWPFVWDERVYAIMYNNHNLLARLNGQPRPVLQCQCGLNSSPSLIEAI